MDYDKCNEDAAKTKGLPAYCRELFRDQRQFYFWSPSDLNANCDKLKDVKPSGRQKDECALLNEHIYGQYHDEQMKVLHQIKDFTHAAVQKQTEKSKKVKEFVESETKDAAEEGAGAFQDKRLIEEACTFALANQDDPNDKSLQSICDYTNTKMSQKLKKEGLLPFLSKGKEQFQQCESDHACKSSMSQEMKDSGKKIIEFMERLSAHGESNAQKQEKQ